MPFLRAGERHFLGIGRICAVAESSRSPDRMAHFGKNIPEKLEYLIFIFSCIIKHNNYEKEIIAYFFVVFVAATTLVIRSVSNPQVNSLMRQNVEALAQSEDSEYCAIKCFRASDYYCMLETPWSYVYCSDRYPWSK